MVLSKYTKFINHSKGLFLYNSLSNCLLKTDKELFDILYSAHLQNGILDESKLNAAIVAELKKALIIINHINDDKLHYCAVIWGRRKTNDVYNITIAPTMDCNFRCYYCFEDRKKKKMDDETIAKIGKYFSNIDNARYINLTWFGGEPLMETDIIDKISQLLNKFDDDVLNCKIITNGYFLSEKVTDSLKRWHIKDIQITVDGLYDDYDKIKYTKNDKHCFNTLIHNVDYFARKYKDIFLSIRVNMNRDNRDEYYKIVDFFANRYPNNPNIRPYAAFLKNINNSTAPSKACTYCSIEDQISFSLSMFEKTKNQSYIYPRNEFDECAIRNHNSWAFGPEGSVYKCWENIGNENERVGILDTEGRIKIIDNDKVNQYYYGGDPLYSDDCKDCSYLPICQGRCPRQRILEELKQAEKEPCMKDTNCLDKYLDKIISNQYDSHE